MKCQPVVEVKGAERDCVFCRIVRGELPAYVVREWEDYLAFVPLNPVTHGHVLVIPKVHRDDFKQDPTVTAEVMRRAALMARGPCNLITSAGSEASQTVFHLHVHLIPRRPGDGLLLPWSYQADAPGGHP